MVPAKKNINFGICFNFGFYQFFPYQHLFKNPQQQEEHVTHRGLQRLRRGVGNVESREKCDAK